jgi:hypothetical protein
MTDDYFEVVYVAHDAQGYAHIRSESGAFPTTAAAVACATHYLSAYPQRQQVAEIVRRTVVRTIEHREQS